MAPERPLSASNSGTQHNPITDSGTQDNPVTIDSDSEDEDQIVAEGRATSAAGSRRPDGANAPIETVTTKALSAKSARVGKSDGASVQSGSTKANQSVATSKPASTNQTISTPSRRDEVDFEKPTEPFKDKASTLASDDDDQMEDVMQESSDDGSMREIADSEMIDATAQFIEPEQAERFPLNYEAILQLWDKHCKRMHRDHIRFSTIKLRQARYQQQEAAKEAETRYSELHEKTLATQSNPNWYKSLPAINVTEKTTDSVVMTIQNCRPGGTKMSITVQPEQIQPDAVSIPKGTAYIDIEKSQLAPSQKDLFAWPDAIDDSGLDENGIRNLLHKQLDFRLDGRDREVISIQTGRQYQPYAKKFLEELELSEIKMLKFIFDDSFDTLLVGKGMFLSEHLKNKALEVATERLKSVRKQVETSLLWPSLKSRMQRVAEREGTARLDIQTDFKYMMLAFEAIASHDSSPDVNFSVWYMLIASPTLDLNNVLRHSDSSKPKPTYSAATHFDLACQTCFVFGCRRHGLASEWDHKRAEEDEDDEEESDHSKPKKGKAKGGKPKEAPDFKLKPITEHLTSIYHQEKSLRTVQAPTGQRKRDHEFDEPNLYHDPNTWRPPKIIDEKGAEHERPKNLLFFPCDHEGDCVVGVCRCAKAIIERDEDRGVCEKSCGCPPSCSIRFRGCMCAAKGRPCSAASRCPCVAKERECDVDLCSSCGVFDILAPENRDKPKGFFKESCQNCEIQRGISKHTLIGHSTRHGTGLFAAEVIQKGEFVDEYVGEKVSWNESERRGRHDKLGGVSYLFDTGVDQTIDSMRLGNKTRFINHENGSSMNLEQRKRLINGEYRLAFFAKKKINAGQELFFDYGESFWQEGNPDSGDEEVVVPVKSSKRKRKKKVRSKLTEVVGQRSQGQMERMQEALMADEGTSTPLPPQVSDSEDEDFTSDSVSSDEDLSEDEDEDEVMSEEGSSATTRVRAKAKSVRKPRAPKSRTRREGWQDDGSYE